MRSITAQNEIELLRRRVAELEASLRDRSYADTGNYKSIFNLAAVGIAQATIPEGHFVAVNRKMTEILGYEEGELIGLRFLDVTHPEDVPRNRELYADLIAGRMPSYAFEKRYIRKDGTFVWVNTTISLVRDEAGRPTHSLGIIEDITERKRATDRFRALANTIPAFVWMADENGRSTYLSEAWYAFTGLTESLGDGWINAVHPDDVELCQAVGRDAIRQQVPYEIELRYRRRDGQYRWYLARALPVADASSGTVSWFGTSTDIDDYKRTEAALRRSKADLEQFAYAAAHDLQEPLRNISIYAELLARRYRGKLAGDADLYIKHTTEGARRLQRLVEDLLAYTRVVHDDKGPQTPVDCTAVLQDAIANLLPAIEESGAEIQFDPLPAVNGAATHVLQLFQNLIGNAIKYRGGAAPKIRISATRDGDMWRFAVSDNGIGIHPDYHQRIFGVFKRLHGRDVAGTGIGLAICKRIVEHAGGTIWVESAGNGSGSTFLFTLPAA